METGGLVITKAIYGASKALTKGDESASQVVDVTVPLNFLVNDSGQLKVCFFLRPALNMNYILVLMQIFAKIEIVDNN